MATQDLIRGGVRKRIETWSQVKIWDDPWLPDNNNAFVESARVQGLENATVESLRNVEDGQWDTDVLKDLFNERDHQLILSIPLSTRGMEDRWFWPEEKKGMYTVESGYKMLTNQKLSLYHVSCINWQKIWKLKIPGKIKNFLCRAQSKCLSTMKALQSRKVDVQAWCPLCHQEEEDDIHVLVLCPSARNVWLLSPLGFDFKTVNTIQSWWTDCITTRSQKEMEIAAVLSWSIWKNRNEVVWNQKSIPGDVSVRLAMDLLDQWSAANKINVNQSNVSSSEQQRHWRKPPGGSSKCNVDAAIFDNPSHAGYGCILRDAQGSVKAAMHVRIPGAQSPSTAEALSIREALSWLKDLQVQNVIVESDAQVVIAALNNPISDLSAFGLIIEDCTSLATEIPGCSFTFAFNSANQVVNVLARATASISGQGGWVYLPYL